MGTQTHASNRLTCPPNHKHGATSTCYGTHGCRCTPCRQRNAAWKTVYRKRIAYGRPTTDLVDAQPARQHVETLRAAGLGQDRIAELAGIPTNILRHLLYGTSGVPPAERIRASNAQAILNVYPDPSQGLLLDPRGVRRRLHALAVRGWTYARLAERLGVRTEAIHSYLESVQVTRTTRDRIAELFDDLWDQDPPQSTRGERAAASRMKSLAARNGWVGPLAWDDIDNDEQPAEVTGHRYSGARAREEDVRTLHAQRLGDRKIAERMGIAPETVFHIRHRLGLPAWSMAQQKEAA